MANNFSRSMGNNLVTLLGWFTFLWALQQMGSTDVVFLPRDVIAYCNNTWNDIHEVRDA